MKEIKIQKSEITFTFNRPYFDEYGKYKFHYSISCVNNGKIYMNAELLLDKKAITFCEEMINGKKCNGVLLPESEFNTVKAWYDKDLEIRNEYIKQLVNDLISGVKKIRWSVVGCDYPEYQPWIEGLNENHYAVQDIMGEAALRIYKSHNLGNYLPGMTVCDFLEDSFHQRIGIISDMNAGTENYKFDKKKQDYHGYNDNIVTSFETTLETAMNLGKLLSAKKIADEKEKDIKDKEAEAFRKAKETGEKQEIRHWIEDCNDPKEECDLDYVYLYAMPDGTTKSERFHTW